MMSIQIQLVEQLLRIRNPIEAGEGKEGCSHRCSHFRERDQHDLEECDCLEDDPAMTVLDGQFHKKKQVHLQLQRRIRNHHVMEACQILDREDQVRNRIQRVLRHNRKEQVQVLRHNRKKREQLLELRMGQEQELRNQRQPELERHRNRIRHHRLR